MNRLLVASIVLSGVVAAGMAPAVQADEDSLLRMSGRFKVDNGEVKVVKRRQAERTYRVCMDEGAAAVPLRVVHDGLETVVVPGECTVITASKIALAAHQQLPEGYNLIGRFVPAGVSRKSYTTEISVAQAR